MTIRDILLTNLKKKGLLKTEFGVYSLRSEEAMTATNFVINDRSFQKHKKWKSENDKNGHFNENLRTLLSVSKNLGP